MDFPILTVMTFLPLLGGIMVLFVPEKQRNLLRGIALGFSGAALLLSIWALLQFDPGAEMMQFEEQYSWIPSIAVSYHIGVDGLSFPLILLTTALSFIAVIVSFSIKEKVRGYFALFLLLETGMIGVFASLDLFLFYVFWEIMLVPMYFLIGIWGGERKEYAAIKFFLYTLFGSVIMLLGILALYFTAVPHTFDIPELMAQTGNFVHWFQIVVFMAFFIGFAIKVPVFPFHTWLPDAHVEAPTAISVVLAAILLKMGIYGLMRISFPILPEGAHWFALPLAILGAINIVYGALVAMAQKDLKKLIAYSSVSHMGFCLLGLAAMTTIAFNGVMMQMIAHGVVTGGLFIMVGVIYDRTHDRKISSYSGLAHKVPVYVGVFSLTMFASLGLPGLAGFVGEFLSFAGAFPVFKWVVIASAPGVVITAAYFLWTIQRMFLGKDNGKWPDLKDMTPRELVTMVPLVILMIALGVWPRMAIDLMDPTMNRLAELMATFK